MTDQQGASLERILREFELRLQKLETGSRAGPGLQIGKASGPFLLPNASPAGDPASGVYLYASGGSFRWRSSTGDDFAVPGQAANVIVPGITLGSAPGSYSQAHSQQLVDGLTVAYNNLIALIVNLRAGRVLIV